MEQFKLREKSKKQKASPACFNTRRFLNVHRLLLTLGDLPVLSMEARIGKKQQSAQVSYQEAWFETPGFGRRHVPLVLHSLPRAFAQPSLCLCSDLQCAQLCCALLHFETSSMQGSVIQPHFQLLLASLRPFPRAPCGAVGRAGCWMVLAPLCPSSPACGHFWLPPAGHRCPVQTRPPL